MSGPGCSPENEFPHGLEGLVFDIDGVMLDSCASNMEYYNLVRRAVQLPPVPKEDYEYCQMATVNQALEYIIPVHLREAAYEACRKINYAEQILPMLSLEDGLLEALHWLKLWEVRLAICTNRTTQVDSLLRYFGLESFFHPVMTAAVSTPKPSPDGLLRIMAEWDVSPCSIAFIGDSKVDEQSARNAGVPFWAFRSPTLDARLHFDGFFKMITLITPLVEGR